MSTIPSLYAVFQPQFWADDHAIDLHSAGFDAGKAFLSLSAREMNAAVGSILAGKTHDLDAVAEKQGLVGGDGKHNGPFYVRIDLGDFEDWCKAIGTSPETLHEIGERELGELRQSVGMRKDAVDVMMRGEIVDWRIGDGEGDDLTENQKKLWPVEIMKSGYDGLMLEFKAPDGTTRSLMIELDQGNLKVLAYRDPQQSEAPDCALHILTEGTAVVSTGVTETGYMLYHEHGSHREKGDIPASFVDEGALPSP